MLTLDYKIGNYVNVLLASGILAEALIINLSMFAFHARGYVTKPSDFPDAGLYAGYFAVALPGDP
jgi:hypothetical protein